MSNITYLFAALFIIGWAVGFFVLGLGSYVHMILVFALVLLLARIVSGKHSTE
ncbi:MAG: lmo0937 family membrane protein [Bacteroidetes bacterium]|nr:lmo0937 family membrane protein [Bacteroidota bacterium]